MYLFIYLYAPEMSEVNFYVFLHDNKLSWISWILNLHVSPGLKLVIRLVYEIYTGANVAGANVMESYTHI